MTCSCSLYGACHLCKPEIFKPMPNHKPVAQQNAEIADQLEIELTEAKHAYYCEGKPMMTDYKYDKLESILREIRPESKVLSGVGCITCFKEEV
jgi:hypothetical protein